MNEASAIIIILTTVIKLVLQKSLKSMWGAVEILQFVVYFFFIKVRLSAPARLFLEELKTIALGEFIPQDWLKQKTQEILPEHFNRTDDEGIFGQVGTVIILVTGLILITLSMILLGKYNKKLSETMRKCVEKIKSKLIWNAFIRCSLQSYLQIGFISIPNISYTKSRGIFKTAFARVNLIIVLALPVLYGILLLFLRESMKQEKIKAKIGSLFLGIRNFTKWQALYSVVFLLRRFVFVCILVNHERTPAIIIQLVIALNIVFAIYLSEVRPHDSV